MIRHTSHSVTGVTLPHLFSPAEVAEALGCSEWWVKEQARKGRIPYTKPGGRYRFTAEHVAEITRIFERRPASSAVVTPGTAPAPAAPRRGSALKPSETVTRLTAKPPRRLLRSQTQITAA